MASPVSHEPSEAVIAARNRVPLAVHDPEIIPQSRHSWNSPASRRSQVFGVSPTSPLTRQRLTRPTAPELSPTSLPPVCAQPPSSSATAAPHTSATRAERPCPRIVRPRSRRRWLTGYVSSRPRRLHLAANEGDAGSAGCYAVGPRLEI